MNEAYQDVVKHLIGKLEKAVASNRGQQEELHKMMRAQTDADSVARKKVPVSMFLPPYFKDSNNMVAPLNEEAKQKLNQMVYDPLMKEEKKWTSAELKKLREAVANAVTAQKLAPYQNKKDLLNEQLKASGVETTDAQRNMVREQIERLDREMAQIRHSSET